MEQQQQPAQGAPTDEDGAKPTPAPIPEAGEETWGQGSATALETLRRRNFRGHRASSWPADERPSSS